MRKNSQILAPLYEVVSVVVVVKVGVVVEVVVRRSKRVLEGTTHGVGSGSVPMEQASRGSVEGRVDGGGQLKRIPQRDCYPLSERLNSIVMRNRS